MLTGQNSQLATPGVHFTEGVPWPHLMRGQGVTQVVQVNQPVLGGVERAVEGIPHLVLSSAGTALEDNGLRRVCLPRADPRHEVPWPLGLVGDVRDLRIEVLEQASTVKSEVPSE